MRGGIGSVHMCPVIGHFVYASPSQAGDAASWSPGLNRLSSSWALNFASLELERCPGQGPQAEQGWEHKSPLLAAGLGQGLRFHLREGASSCAPRKVGSGRGGELGGQLQGAPKPAPARPGPRPLEAPLVPLPATRTFRQHHGQGCVC